MNSERPSSKIIIQVVGAVLAAAILYLFRSLLPPIGKWFLGIFVAAWGFLIAGHSIPGWLLLIFVACSLVVVSRVLLRFRRNPSKPREPTERDYVPR